MKDTKTQLHPGFVAAMNLEFKENRKDLIFEKHTLSIKPIEHNRLIIKKDSADRIPNEISAFFRGHNIIEYKSPKDSLNIDMLYKSMAYALLYKANGKSVDERKANDITVSIIKNSKPKELFKFLDKHGYPLTTHADGIYYIEKTEWVPIQIIVIEELSEDTLVRIREFLKNLPKEDNYGIYRKEQL